jgi:Sec-independent protein secretion pathway component TatC
MRNTYTAFAMAILWPSLSRAQQMAASESSGLTVNEKLMLFAFTIAAILLFLAGKFAYDMIFRKKH